MEQIDCFIMDDAFKLIRKNLKDMNGSSQFDGQIMRSHFQFLLIHKVEGLCNRETGKVVDTLWTLHDLLVRF